MLLYRYRLHEFDDMNVKLKLDAEQLAVLYTNEVSQVESLQVKLKEESSRYGIIIEKVVKC